MSNSYRKLPLKNIPCRAMRQLKCQPSDTSRWSCHVWKNPETEWMGQPALFPPQFPHWINRCDIDLGNQTKHSGGQDSGLLSGKILVFGVLKTEWSTEKYIDHLHDIKLGKFLSLDAFYLSTVPTLVFSLNISYLLPTREFHATFSL